MPDTLREECGLVLLRLKKPLSYYLDKYGNALWGFSRLFLLMEKQHNRGQDGAGVGVYKMSVDPGRPYMFRQRQVQNNSLDRVFNTLLRRFNQLEESGYIKADDPESLKRHFEFAGEIYIGHLRYGTSGGYNISACHPYFRKNNWPTRNLMMAGNFNITNASELNQDLIDRGQHPIFDTDTQTLLEEIGYHLDQKHQELYHTYKESGLQGANIAKEIQKKLPLEEVLRKASKRWDGGYALGGIVGNGDCFVLRDPHGIRPLYAFENEEIFAAASERAPLMTVFDTPATSIVEVGPGQAIIITNSGESKQAQIREAEQKLHCSFERIYFSRGNDPAIYQERKALGAALVDQILNSVDNQISNCVFSFIPNTSEIAYYGLINAIRDRAENLKKRDILALTQKGQISADEISEIFTRYRYRVEKVAQKDIKLRTFISQEKGRNKLASHVYDVCYGTAGPQDHLICIDDSIVRGTTLKQSIIKILSRLHPRTIVIVSTAPQIRYPDCYGIDMSQLEKFIAFQAAVTLLREAGEATLLDEIYKKCQEDLATPGVHQINHVKVLYKRFTAMQISEKIAELVSPQIPDWKGQIKVIFQSIENLHNSLTVPCGDWYFTGDYPTPGGYRVANQAFINFYEKRQGRSY